MAGYDNWTVVVKKDILLRLLIDGRDIVESIPGTIRIERLWSEYVCVNNSNNK